MADSREVLENSFILELPIDLLLFLFNYLLSDLKDASRFARSTNRRLYASLFHDEMEKLALQQFWQAIVDDDVMAVTKILSHKPFLSLHNPQYKLTIESQKTWQIFHIGDMPLTFALKRRKLEITNILISFFDELKTRNLIYHAKLEILHQWHLPIIDEDVKKRYSAMMSDLIVEIKNETFSCEGIRLIDKINDKTKNVLAEFRNKLLPKEGILLDQYYDLELLLIVSYEAYFSYAGPQNWSRNLRDLYSISVIGFILSLQIPELGKIFCYGFDDCYKNNIFHISDSKLVLEDNKTEFYRTHRDLQQGHGFDYIVGTQSNCYPPLPLLRVDVSQIKNYIQRRQQVLINLGDELNQSINLIYEPKN